MTVFSIHQRVCMYRYLIKYEPMPSAECCDCQQDLMITVPKDQ